MIGRKSRHEMLDGSIRLSRPTEDSGMALRNRLVAFLFGLVFQMTLVAMSFVGFPIPSTPWEYRIQRFADIIAWIVIPVGVAFFIFSGRIMRRPDRRTARGITIREWVLSFLLGFGLSMGLVAMGLAGGYFGPATPWQNMSRHISEAIVLALCYAGAAFALFDIALLWHGRMGSGLRTVLRTTARVALAATLLSFAAGSFLGSWASGTVFAFAVFLIATLGIVLDLSNSGS
jgi:hypothetical protein